MTGINCLSRSSTVPLYPHLWCMMLKMMWGLLRLRCMFPFLLQGCNLWRDHGASSQDQ